MGNSMVLDMENALVARNAQADLIANVFETVKHGIQVAMCSDCCGSNGNSCDPTNSPYPQG